MEKRAVMQKTGNCWILARKVERMTDKTEDLLSCLSIRNARDADSRDGKKVEGGRANNGAGTKSLGFKVVSYNPNDGQKYFRSRGP